MIGCWNTNFNKNTNQVTISGEIESHKEEEKDNYKYQEFGIVEGKVQNISLTPDKDGNYYVDVLLPKGLKTSYNKELPFDKELKGNAEIVTNFNTISAI